PDRSSVTPCACRPSAERRAAVRAWAQARSSSPVTTVLAGLCRPGVMAIEALGADDSQGVPCCSGSRLGRRPLPDAGVVSRRAGIMRRLICAHIGRAGVLAGTRLAGAGVTVREPPRRGRPARLAGYQPPVFLARVWRLPAVVFLSFRSFLSSAPAATADWRR